jgi:DNA-binding response OmpR family regulator
MTRVLVVDDESRIARAVRLQLEAEGFAVRVVASGQGAVRLANEHRYDAIVLCGVNGLSVCRALRDADNWTPILMLIASRGSEIEAEALDTGADDCLTRPLSLVVLVARLRALVRRSGRGERISYEVGDLRIDPAAHRVFRGDVEVRLTATEFSVLELLARRGGEVVSKRAILDHSWDFAFQGDPNIVEVYIRRLRRKIDVPFRRHAIETVRGSGYRLDPAGG